MSDWPHQTWALEEVPRRILAGERKLLVTSPTGGGKTRIICGLIEWAIEQGWQAVLYTNRRLLIEQLGRVLKKFGIEHGVRAAGHEDNRHRQVQISSLPTERSRVLDSKRWAIHGEGHSGRLLALVDEAHLNRSETTQAILAKHHEAGGAYCGFTATPIDLGHLYDGLIVAGTPSELRKCGALVAAYHYGPDEPDMKGFKQKVKTGEYSEGDVRKAIMTKCIFARVLEYFNKINADQRPTILFGPGVAESIWFAEQFVKAGIRAAHIDGEGIWLDGEYRRCAIEERESVLRAVQAGEIKVLCNRFVAREGLDMPEVSHAILATVFGSLQSYLQSVGRIMRACEGKDRATIQDHGGHWWRHGSVNVDRQWDMSRTENMIRGLREDAFREKRSPEPIRCAECGQVRQTGPVCPACGHRSERSSRMVMQVSGVLKEHLGDVFKPRFTRMKPNTIQLWTQCYFRAKNSKKGMTFREAEGLFVHEQHYWPPRDLPLMPKDPTDWFLPVRDVPRERLT